MNSKTPGNVYSRVTFIPWAAMDTEHEEIPERGLHWGTRESNFIVSSLTQVKAKAPDSEPELKSKVGK